MLLIGAAGFISTASRQLPETDIWSMLYPSLRPLLKADVHIITELNLLDTVKESVSSLFRPRHLKRRQRFQEC